MSWFFCKKGCRQKWISLKKDYESFSLRLMPSQGSIPLEIIKRSFAQAKESCRFWAKQNKKMHVVERDILAYTRAIYLLCKYDITSFLSVAI